MDGRCIFFRRLFAKEFLSLPLCLCSPSCIRVPDWLAFLGAQTRSPQFQGRLTARRGSCPNRHWFTKLFKERGEHLVASPGICIPVRASLFILGPRPTRTRSLHGEEIFGLSGLQSGSVSLSRITTGKQIDYLRVALLLLPTQQGWLSAPFAEWRSAR